MTGGPAHRQVVGDRRPLRGRGSSVVHRLVPQAKLVGAGLFVMVVAVTPRRAVVVFAVDTAIIVAVIAIARLRPAMVLARLTVIAPFLLFAAMVPFVAGGEQTDVLSLSLSVEGLWSAWGIAIKALLGASASIVLSATTPITDLSTGMARLRVPPAIVAIVSLMFRYLDLLVDQLRRMRAAMTARCHDPRWLWQARPIAGAAGTLFVRSYERGERIHQAMLARGFSGSMPVLDGRAPRRGEWIAALMPATVSFALLLVVVTAA